jgi:hypothetical protein
MSGSFPALRCVPFAGTQKIGVLARLRGAFEAVSRWLQFHAGLDQSSLPLSAGLEKEDGRIRE